MIRSQTAGLIRSAGPYDELYESSDGLLWPTPGRLVRRAGEWLQRNSLVYEFGCGDGKNAIELASQGHRVAGCDVSSAAIECLRRRFDAAGVEHGSFEVADAVAASVPPALDAVLSYGLYHCMQPATRGGDHARLLSYLRPGGVLLFCSLISSRPLPYDHHTPDLVLPSLEETQAVLIGLDILSLEVGTIEEAHPPLVGRHKHDCLWAVGRKM